MEFEVKRGRDVGIWRLLEGQPDVESDGLAAGLPGAAVGCLHDAGASAGGDHKAVPPRRNGLRPGGEQLRQPPCVLVVTGHFDSRHGSLALQVRGLAGGDLRRAGRLLMARSRTARPRVVQGSKGWVGLSAPRNRAEPKNTTVS